MAVMLRLEHILMAVVAGIAFQLSLALTHTLDQHFAYVQGISLLFLPAGIKLFFVLIGRIPALLGLTVMAAYATLRRVGGPPHVDAHFICHRGANQLLLGCVRGHASVAH
jgi:hypothetical protein